MKKTNLVYTALFFALMCWACARPGNPTGGPKDTTPPKVDTALSTRNFITRFNEKKIELSFDEWVVLKETAKQIVVSPPVAKRPEAKIKGKTVILQFDENEQFRPNTTYTINFGTAVRDLHEDNPATDLRFVFSTGDVIDSLQIQGFVADAYEGKPQENIAVMVYDNSSDSIILKDRPYYFSRTDKNGRFLLSNIRPGTFKVVAIEDADQNLKWSPPGERIAFADSLLVLRDSVLQVPTLRLFADRATPRLLNGNTKQYGNVVLSYTAPPDGLMPRANLEGISLQSMPFGDSLLVWYTLSGDSLAWEMLVGSDTVRVPALSTRKFQENFQLRWAEDAPAAPVNQKRNRNTVGAPTPSTAAPARQVTQLPSKQAILSFNYPIAGIDTSLVRFVVDSTRITAFSFLADTLDPRVYTLSVNWKYEKSHRLELLPGAASSFYGLSNTDTLVQIYNVPPEKQLGSITLSVEELVTGMDYLFQLKNGAQILEERRFKATADQETLIFKGLPAQVFTAVLVEDSNGNGRWDSGNYFAHRQPEKVFIQKLEQLRANWELETSMHTSKVKKM
ncbi:MAG: Ig-like domain-containing protein [Lewinellaceae bacterium]|nr:Ig-like domain-containing protein [Lewinellaceae bacterium]